VRKKILLAGWLLLLSVGVISIFWYNDWVYSLPTPVPVNYKPVATGQEIAAVAKINPDNGKPLFIHFFNPDCPCSKFNVSHFKSIVKEYGQLANFAIVVVSSKTYSKKDIQERFETTIPVYTDTSIADACGVYSTPQAVIIDTRQKLYYRGNYNKSRYCSEKKTEYARAALDAVLHQTSFLPEPYAVKAYGCRLPKCTK